MVGESAGSNLRTRGVNKGPLDGLRASFTATLKKIKVILQNFDRLFIYSVHTVLGLYSGNTDMSNHSMGKTVDGI